MDELGAQLDRHRSSTVPSSEDAASNALARFDDNDIETGIVQSVHAAVTPAAPPPMTSTSAFNFVMPCAETGRSCAECDRLGGATSTVFVIVGVMRALALHMSWLVFPKEGYMSIRHAYSLIGALFVATLLSNADAAFADRHKGTPTTLVGCIMRESDFRELNGHSGGGWLNTGAGVGNEYILVNAVPGPINEQTAAEANCENMSGGRTYELKGPAERKRNLEPFVGHRIEVSGRIENAKTDLAVGTSGELVAGQPTGGPVNPRRRDLRLFEMRMDSFREIPIAQPVALFVEPEAAPVAPPEPAPAPAPEPQVQQPAPAAPAPAPTVLPKTASPMELMGLLGLLSMGGAFGLRTWRLR